jgi:hypothetical protein
MLQMRTHTSYFHFKRDRQIYYFTNLNDHSYHRMETVTIQPEPEQVASPAPTTPTVPVKRKADTSDDPTRKRTPKARQAPKTTARSSKLRFPSSVDSSERPEAKKASQFTTSEWAYFNAGKGDTFREKCPCSCCYRYRNGKECMCADVGVMWPSDAGDKIGTATCCYCCSTSEKACACVEAEYNRSEAAEAKKARENQETSEEEQTSDS